MAGAARGLCLGAGEVTFFVVATALIVILANVWYLFQMARARSRSLAELFLLMVFDAGLIWIIVAQMSARPGV